MLYPGRRYVGDSVRLAINWQNDEGTDVDPSTDVILKTMSPSGTITTYNYSETELTRESTGDYYKEITPDESGRWFYQWQATGTSSRTIQGSFVVQADPFTEDLPTSDYGRNF